MRRIGLGLVFGLVLAGTPSAADAAPAKKVLILAIDGCRVDALQQARTPNLDALVADGYASFNARTCRHSHSGPAWSSILGGVWEEKHLILDNSFSPKDLTRYPPLFVRLKERKPDAKSAMIVDWAPLKQHLSAGTYRADLITTPQSRDFVTQDALVTTRAVEFLGTENPDVLFVYWVNVDETGHASGFSPDNPRYIAAIEKVDEQVGMVLGALRRRPSYPDEDWLIITTTDHGGTGNAHGRDIPLHTTTFLFVSGSSARKGRASEPAFAVDVAATALAHLLGGPSMVAPAWNLDGRVFGLAAPAAGFDAGGADAPRVEAPDAGGTPEAGGTVADRAPSSVEAGEGAGPRTGADAAAPRTPGTTPTPGDDMPPGPAKTGHPTGGCSLASDGAAGGAVAMAAAGALVLALALGRRKRGRRLS